MQQATALSLLEAGRWEAARDAFERDLAVEESAEAHDGLGRVEWLLGHLDEALTHRERGYLLWRQSGNRERAAIVAAWLAREQILTYDNPAAANGWLARAERIVGDDSAMARGWLELARGRCASSLDEREQRAASALELATEMGDASLEILALADLGLASVERGDPAGAVDYLDEAMVAATNGETRQLETVAETCCTMVAVCELTGDSGRLEQWADVVTSFSAQRENLPLLGFCGTCDAEILAAAGDRKDGEQALGASAAALRQGGYKSRCVDPSVRLAEARLLQGRLEEADALLQGKQDLPEAVLVTADLDCARGLTSLAAARLLRRINVMGRDNVLAAPLLCRLVEVQLAAGDQAAASETTETLVAISATPNTLANAHAEYARALVAREAGLDAAAHFQEAADAFERLGARLEAAVALLALARVTSDATVASDYAARALTSFNALGATRFGDEAAALQRSLGGPARTGDKHVGALTTRETEVLRLLGVGLTNAEIASRLFIATKTASHHVSNVLAKLQLRSRQEAAAYAVRAYGNDTISDRVDK